MTLSSPPECGPRLSRAARPLRQAALALAVAAAALSGCRRDEVTRVRVPKQHAAPQLATPAAMAEGEPGADQRANPDRAGEPVAAPAQSAVRWKLPQGWTQSVSGGMRYATLHPPVPGRVEASVVVLAGAAGGELANVNRWRGQIGLAPIEEASLASVRKVLASKAGPVSLYDFTSEGQKKSRVVAAVAVAGGQSWFLKLTGDAEPVTAARADFLRLLESLQVE